MAICLKPGGIFDDTIRIVETLRPGVLGQELRASYFVSVRAYSILGCQFVNLPLQIGAHALKLRVVAQVDERASAVRVQIVVNVVNTEPALRD